jgi:phospholipase/carboxylesterase
VQHTNRKEGHVLDHVVARTQRSATCRCGSPSAGEPAGVTVSRRAALAAAATGMLAGCTDVRSRSTARPSDVPEDPLRLTARPDPSAPPSLKPGTTSVPLTTGRYALLHVPPGAVTTLVVVLHGAGGSAENGLSLLRKHADARGLVLLAPSSAGPTWDAITGSGARDTAALDAALRDVLSALPLEMDRVAVAGFSDGASYALTIGLTNGDLLRRVVAFSPGFSAAREQHGRPAFLVTHGVHDKVLPIERTSRRVVPVLQRAGYNVDYREFDGGHVLPPDLAEDAAQWLGS